MREELCCNNLQGFIDNCDNKTNYYISIYRIDESRINAPFAFHYSDPHPMSEGYGDFTEYFKFCPFCGSVL